MKKVTISSMIVIVTILLSACSSPTALLQGGATNTVKTDTKAEAVQPAQPITYTKPVVQATAPVVPASQVSTLLAAYEGALSSVYEAVNPSVVNIRVVQKASATDLNSQQSPFPFPSIPGMPNIPNNGLPQSQPYQEALGSGFVLDQQGHIVTNNHVIEGADKIEITFSDGTIVPAKVVGADPDSDLAVLKVDVAADKLKPVQFTDSTQVKVGDLAIAIGNPFGLEGTMTTGIISAVGRTMPAGGLSQSGNGPTYSIPDIIQTDASINPGNSGGVLVNDQGLVIGVTFAIESSTRSSAGIGFVIPSSLVTRVVPALIKDGSYQHTYLGITGGTLTPTLAQAMKLDPTQRGVLVSQVNSGTPAEKAGLHGSNSETTVDGEKVPIGGDVIIAVDGNPVTKMDDVIAYLADNTTVGQKVTLTILRNGKQQDIQVTLEARPAPQTAQSPTTSPTEASTRSWLGITGGTLTPDVAQAMNLNSDQTGVLVVTVQSGSPADNAGMKGSDHTATIGGQQVPLGGDVIIAIDGQQIGSMEDLGAMLQNYSPGDKVTVTVLRGSQQLDLSLTLGERPATQ
jgi:S1-C subfamily serine protease